MIPISRNSPRTVLACGYGSGATRGRNLGSPGYSYDFVVQLFEPLFQRCGEFELIDDPETELAERVAAARGRGKAPVFLCFRGLHDSLRADDAPSVVVPAWEFPDVPDHAFSGNAKNDWVRVANECSRVIVHGEFTRDAFVRCGVRAPISLVPVPTPASYFDVVDWNPGGCTQIARSAIVACGDPIDAGQIIPIDSGIAGKLESAGAGDRSRSSHFHALMRGAAKGAYKRVIRPILPYWLDAGITAGGRAAFLELFRSPAKSCTVSSPIELSGVVYTSIFNPDDGRKNWEDLLSAFLIGLGDCDDATLVLKLIGRNSRRANAILARYRDMNLTHRCRVVIVTDYLSDAEMLELTRASTYYVTSTRAEGNCLPLMNFLAAGRPAITPSHTAIADYFTDRMGFVVESHAEPCAWPHDPELRTRTSWQRLVWPSLVQSLRESYRIARKERSQYQELAAAGRAMSWQRHHPSAVLPKLQAALDAIFPANELAEPRRAAA